MATTQSQTTMLATITFISSVLLTVSNAADCQSLTFDGGYANPMNVCNRGSTTSSVFYCRDGIAKYAAYSGSHCSGTPLTQNAENTFSTQTIVADCESETCSSVVTRTTVTQNCVDGALAEDMTYSSFSFITGLVCNCII